MFQRIAYAIAILLIGSCFAFRGTAAGQCGHAGNANDRERRVSKTELGRGRKRFRGDHQTRAQEWRCTLPTRHLVFESFEERRRSAVLQIANTISPNPIYGFALARGHACLQNKAKVFEVSNRPFRWAAFRLPNSKPNRISRTYAATRNFIEVVKKADLAANPCKGRPEHRQFDFWIGEWRPKNAQGVTVGTSSIQLILSSCVIFENWNTPISSGKSFRNFDAKDGKWHQTWVDDKGTLAFYTGGLVDGKMVLDGEQSSTAKDDCAYDVFQASERRRPPAW